MGSKTFRHLGRTKNSLFLFEMDVNLTEMDINLIYPYLMSKPLVVFEIVASFIFGMSRFFKECSDPQVA
jgi:hypothetical protein